MATPGISKLEEHRKECGLTESTFAQAVSKHTGVAVSRDIVCHAESYCADERERVAIARPKAEAICKYLSAELGRSISIHTLGLKVI